MPLFLGPLDGNDLATTPDVFSRFGCRLFRRSIPERFFFCRGSVLVFSFFVRCTHIALVYGLFVGAGSTGGI